MNVKLRKRHRMMWLVLGIALPLLCLEALESIPKRNIAQIPIVSCPADITDCGITERHEISEHILEIKVVPGDSISQVQVAFDQPLVSAFTVAYLSQGESVSENSPLLGGLNGMGAYTFKVPAQMLSQHSNLVIYDKIKAQTLFVQNLNELKP